MVLGLLSIRTPQLEITSKFTRELVPGDQTSIALSNESQFQGVVIGDDVILSPGCKILGKEGVLQVARGSVIGANAVLLESTGEDEIWAGIPAKCVGKRPR